MQVGTRGHFLARFEDFALNIRTGELSHGNGNVIRLPEQSLQILAMLVERPGEVVSREEIRKRLWPNDTIVEYEHSISAAMNRLRQALGDSAEEPVYIETLARRGYRWMRPVEWVDTGERPGAAKTPGAPSISLYSSLIGRKVSHYRVLEFIGGGGMGIVYKAEDIKLARQVALKFLPEELSGDQHALKRFEHEARAASALNHPNICTIYEIDDYEGQPFLVMELLEGDTLREVVSGRASHEPLELTKLLELGVQIASGLEAAHEKGIVHRDVKPSNIFITKRGVAKLLDFGIAKLLQPDRSSDSDVTEDSSRFTPTENPTLRSLHLTRTGAALGTEGYMSPEQVRGEELDARTDLFSFGLVLYEMAAGQRAFCGDTAAVVQDAVLHRSPPRLRQLNPKIPAALEMIIAKALEKDRDLRYQTAAGMLADLNRTVAATTASSHFDGPTAQPRSVQSPSSIRTIGVAVAALLVAGAIVGSLRWIHFRSPHRDETSEHQLAVSSNRRVVPLTDLGGSAWGAVLSPDARLFAFFWSGENPQKSDLYVQLVGGEKPLRLTQASSESICCATWSPDGREIAFARCNNADNKLAEILTIPALGGAERKLTDVACLGGVSGYPTWTSDGRSLVISDRCAPGGPIGVVKFSLQTGEKLCLTKPPSNDLIDLYPALSPNQKTVAFVKCDGGTGTKCDLYTVAVDGGNLQQLTTEKNDVTDLVWSADGKYISFSSDRRGVHRPWRVPAGGGAIEQETVNPELASISRDGRHAIYMDGSETSSIWRADLSRAGGPVLESKQVISRSYPEYNVHLSSDGHQIVFASTRTGHYEIWKSDSDGSDPVQLTTLGGFAGSPRWSPDDRWIVFDYVPEIHGQLYVMDAEGRNLHQVTSGNYQNVTPTWSRDGKSIYFSSNRTGQDQIWKRELKSGQETQITRAGGQVAVESFDSRTLYYSQHDVGGIWSIPVTGGEEKQITEDLYPGYWGYFAVTDSGIYLVDSEAKPGPTIMFYSFQTRRLTPVLAAKQKFFKWSPNFTASRDGRKVLFGQIEARTKLMLVEYLR